MSVAPGSPAQFQAEDNGINAVLQAQHSFAGNNNGQLEYTWNVAAGANPGQIQLGFSASAQLSVNAAGDLQIAADGQTLTQQAPVAYQVIDGARQAVDAHFVLEANQQVGIALGQYDRGQPLVIDPVLTATNGTLLGAPVSAAAGNTPDSIGTLKLDDGQELLLVANYYDNDVSVLQNNGGTWTTLATLPTGDGPNGFAVGDFTGSGHQDFAVANYLSNSVTIYLGDGTGNFTAGPTLATGSGPANEIAIGDFNGSGYPSLATANMNDGTVSVFLNNGGTFAPAVNTNVGAGVMCITAGDFTGTGRTDLAVGNFDNSTVTVLSNSGSGTFTVGSPIAVGANPWYLTAADLTGNGEDDLATANFYGGVSVLLSNGDDTFQPAVNYAAGANPTGIAAADLTGTGQLDLVVSNYSSNSTSVLLNTGDGTFLPAENFAAGPGPNGVAVADLNNDGKLDVATADQNSGQASVLANTSLQATEGLPFSGTIGGFTDSANPPASSLSVTVNWGDGSPIDNSAIITATGGGSYTVSGTHTYARVGAYTIQEYVRDASGDETTISNIVYVGDAPLTVTSSTISATPVIGQPFTAVVASFSDADPDGQPGDYNATINWGDGTPLDTTAVVTANGAGGFDVTGTHTYNASGNFAVQVTIQDVGGATTTANGTLFVNGPSGGAGQLTVNQFLNSTVANISVGGGPSEEVYLTQFAATYQSTAGQIQFSTFCIDLSHDVSQGQTYAVNPRADLATGVPGGSPIAYIYQQYGEQDLSSNPDQAAAVQTAIWSLLQDPTATTFTQNPDGTYSPDGDEGAFAVNFDGNPDTAAIVALVNAYLSAAQNADPNDDWLDAAPAGNGIDRGQSVLVPSTLINNLASSAQEPTWNPITGDSLSQVGNVQSQLTLNLSQSPSSGCSTAAAANQPSITSALVYNSCQVNAKPVIQLQVPTEAGDPMPTSLIAQLTFNGITQPAQTFPVPANLVPGTTLTLAVQAANPVTQTGRYGWQVQLTANYANGVGTASRTMTGSTIAVDPDQAGTGWSYGMIDQLIPIAADANGPAGVIRVYGTGGASFYQANGNGTFISPAGDNGTLVQNADGSYTYTTPGGVTTNFNSAGEETSQVSTCGCIQYTFTYNADGSLATMTGTDGAYSTFNYDGSGNLTSITVAQSAGGLVMRTYTFTHDSSGNLLSMTDPDGNEYTLGYDSDSHLTSEDLGGETNSWTYQDGEAATIQEGSAAPATLIPSNLQGLNGVVGGGPVSEYTDPDGNVTTTTLDGDGRDLRQVDALGGVTTWVYNSNGYLISTTDPNGNTTNYEVDSDGYVLQTTYPDGSTDHYTYDSLHDILSYTDQNGNTTTYTYDSDGHMLSMTDPLGNTTTYTWSDDLLATMTDPNGGVTQYFYDSARRLIETIDPMGFVTTNTYDSNGFLASTTDANGDTTTFINDPMGRVLEMIDPMGFVTTDTYDANGNLLTETDANGHTTQYIYNDRGLLVETIDPMGYVTTNTYDAAHNLISTTDANGHTTQYIYDALNRQIETIDPMGFVTTTAYDADSNVIASTDANGNTTRYVYNSLDEQVYTIDPLGYVSKTGYDADGNVIYQTDANGKTTTSQYDGDNQQIAATDPLGNTSTTAYDPDGNVIAATDANGNTTTYAYDLDDRQISSTDPLGYVTKTSYDAVGNVIATTDANGYTTTYAYDADDRQISTTDPLGYVTTTTYDPVGNVIATTDANGSTTTYAYNADDEEISQTDPLGYVTRTAYDPVGNIISTTDANGYTTTYTYDADDRQISSTDPLGNVSTKAYDPNGNVIATTDPNGNTTRYGYNADNEQTTVTNALVNTTTTAYDGDGNLISVTDPLGNKTTYAYDADDREIASTNPLGYTETMSYDAVGNLVSTTDFDGRITENTYDADYRLIKMVWLASDGVTVTDTKTYTYDGDGNLLTASDDSGTYTMTYDADDRLVTQTDMFGLTLTYGYDGNGNVVSQQDSLGGTTTSVYDGDNRLVSRGFTDGTTQLRIDFTYDGDGNVLTETRYSDLAGTHKVGSTQSTYDANDLVTSIQHFDGNGNLLASYSYTYDAGSRITSQTVNGVTTPYSYDAINELTADGSTTYAYDANENRTGPGYVIGPNNELLSDGTWNYTYDAEGNVIEKVNIATGETWTYTYNNENQETSATDRAADGTLISQSTYTFDVFRNRIAQAIYTQSSGTTTVTQFAYDDAQSEDPNIWADLDASGSLVTRRIFGDNLDQPLARIDSSGTVAWYLTDYQGSIMALMNNQGQLIDQITYDAFGNILSESNPAAGDRYKFAGMQLNTDGTLYTPGRDDNTQTGRWNQQDPMGVSGTNPNLYTYVSNNPTNSSDPTGNGVAQRQSCGPDVTNWFNKEIAIFRGEVAKYEKEFQDQLKSFWAAFAASRHTLNHYVGRRLLMRRLALLSDYKEREFSHPDVKNPCKKTVTLCGLCIQSNQLGNIMFGILAYDLQLFQESLDYGRGKPGDLAKLFGATGPDKPWTAEGEGHRETAFLIGYAYARLESIMSKPWTLCDAIRILNKTSTPNPLDRGCQSCRPSTTQYSGPQTDLTK